MVSAGKYFVTGEFRFADDSKRVSFPGAHVEVVLACDYEAIERRCRELEEDRDRLVLELRSVRMQRDVRAEACLAAIKERDSLRKEVEHFRKDAMRYRWLRENASDAHMWNDESIDAAINKSS